ncbi:MAG: RnfH family protein [Gammaproteobacteria bacterium]|nr:RnfH family protein [Gammaproteobacteria bacterium]
MAEETIKVEVAYALPGAQELLPLSVPRGTTVREAVELSGLLEKYPDIDLGGENKVGIFGKLCKPEQEMQDGDRAEVYRPLIADPKEVRRRLAAEGKTMGRKQ